MQDVGNMDMNVPVSISEPNTQKSAAFPFIIQRGAEGFQRDHRQPPWCGYGYFFINCHWRTLTHWPVVVHMFGDVCRRVVGREEEFFRLPAD